MILTPEEKRSALEEVLQSTTFVRADRLRKFLRYIGEMEISGRASELCESLIGIEALGQPANYSTAENGFVRRKALDLREKLREVYATELADAKVRIALPKGRYVPRFETVEDGKDIDSVVASEPAIIKEDNHEESAVRPRSREMLRLTLAFALGSLLTCAAFLSWPQLHRLLFPNHSTNQDATLSPSRLTEPGIVYEADSRANIISGLADSMVCNSCDGGRKVGHIGRGSQNFVTIQNIVVGKSGNYIVAIYYFLSGNRSFFVSVNDAPGLEVPLTGTDWMKLGRTAIIVPLNTGANKIKFYNDTGPTPDLSRIVVRSTP